MYTFPACCELSKRFGGVVWAANPPTAQIPALQPGWIIRIPTATPLGAPTTDELWANVQYCPFCGAHLPAQPSMIYDPTLPETAYVAYPQLTSYAPSIDPGARPVEYKNPGTGRKT